MASGSDEKETETPGQPMSMAQQILDKGAELMQSLKPVRQIQQHACTFALYSLDMSRQIETHHYLSRLNHEFLQCPIYDSDHPAARLIGVEYIISDDLFESLPADEQKLWHSHAYEIKAGLWVNPGTPEFVQRHEVQNLAKTYGKFWCTWQVDRGDLLPVGEPALMVSSQGSNMGLVSPDLIRKRDNKYSILSDAFRESRVEIPEPEWINPLADYWRQHGKGFSIQVEATDVKLRAPFP
ncbi:hypothetical protein Ancab_034018 [Ancistrocladus abbreviatus]